MMVMRSACNWKTDLPVVPISVVCPVPQAIVFKQLPVLRWAQILPSNWIPLLQNRQLIPPTNVVMVPCGCAVFAACLLLAHNCQHVA